VSASSLGPALVALGAKIWLVSPSGSREVDAAKFFVTPQNAAAARSRCCPMNWSPKFYCRRVDTHSATYEVRQKEALDWPLATASVVLNMAGTRSPARASCWDMWRPRRGWRPRRKRAGGQSGHAGGGRGSRQSGARRRTPLSQNRYKVQLARVAVKRALLMAATERHIIWNSPD
jgi:xanthine dehydrogenase YagS FAD-binding subunit